jgi:chromosome segregation ATPase
MSASAVIAAEQQLNAVRAVAETQRREGAKQEIRRLRHEGAALIRQFRPLAAQVKQAQADRLRLHYELLRAKNHIAAYRVPLDPLTFPSDENIAAHAAQLVAWQAEQKKLLAQYEDAVRRESARVHAVTIQDRLVHMQFEIQNLTAIAEGRRPGEMAKGGLSTCEDFIGRTDRRFS